MAQKVNPIPEGCHTITPHLVVKDAARAIEQAVIKVTREKIKSLAAGKMGFSTTQVGDLVAAALA